MTPQQTIEQAIEALEENWCHPELLENLHSLLEDMKQQEPVGVVAIHTVRYETATGWREYSIPKIEVGRGKKVKEGDSLYTSPPLPQREGWQWVPVEPTGEMLQAAFIYLEDIDFIATGVYKAMLAAAPKPTEE